MNSIGATLAARLPDSAIVADEMVSASATVIAHLLGAAPHDRLPVTGGSIGQGLPVAVGAACACPGRKVVALEADGSGMYTLQSLWTMARESLDVVTVIFANRRYQILEIEMRRTGAPGFGTAANQMIDIGSPDLDWVSLAPRHGRARHARRDDGRVRRAVSGRGCRAGAATDRSGHRPVNAGFRFSTKCATPSLKSSHCRLARISSVAVSSASPRD